MGGGGDVLSLFFIKICLLLAAQPQTVYKFVIHWLIWDMIFSDVIKFATGFINISIFCTVHRPIFHRIIFSLKVIIA